MYLRVSNTEFGHLNGVNAEKIHDGTVSNTEFGYLNGVTSAIQTQIDYKKTTLKMHLTLTRFS